MARCAGCLKFGLRLSNYVLLALGLAMTVYALWMYGEFEKQAGHARPAAPTTAPTSAPTYTPTESPTFASSWSPTWSPTVPATPSPTAGPTVAPTFAPTLGPTAGPADSDSDTDTDTDVNAVLGDGLKVYKLDVRRFWFVYGVGGAGVLTTLTALTGIFAAGTHSPCLLSCYTYELVLMLLAQAALAIALFTDTGLDKIPDDVTGNEKAVMEFLRTHFDVTKWVALGVLVLEVLSVLLACSLKAAGPVVEEDDEDDLEQPFLPSSTRGRRGEQRGESEGTVSTPPAANTGGGEQLDA